VNNLSPKIKKMIMDGDVPQHVSVEKIKNYRFPMSWMEQEEVFVR
jgi:hypothetical protein